MTFAESRPTSFMAPGCLSGLWCFRQPPFPSDDGIVSPVLAPPGATQPSDEGVQDAGEIEITRPHSPPSSGNADIPVPASTQDSLPDGTGVLTPVLTEAQPAGPHLPEGNSTIPGLAHAEEISSASPASGPTYRLDPAKAKEHIDRIPRFRILVMGRANAGKTTILQRVCNTTDQPEIFNGKGEKVDASEVQGSLTRGLHNIEDELVFRGNPRFVFHDSCGFEAGSEEQFNLMKKFVMDRAKTTKLNERIHAIWFCIPLTDSHRLVMAAEKKFFKECDTGCVPVIVLLTKADTLRLDAVEILMSKGAIMEDAMKGAAEEERKIVDDCLLRVKGWLNDQRFPPCDYLTLTGMQQGDADCTSLLTCTANALKEEGLQKLLISTQQSNLELCMSFAIMKSLKKCMSKEDDKMEAMTLASLLALWFPYVGKGDLCNNNMLMGS
ncbi:hypothetical protein PISMIDRAFT_538595 [Pisolithus microcarpus 441]|uniref:G domain-containing protein n=1 Tax=Pisolithus microcarpus 441 TaxID=765257 RepID=A0A0C9YXZ9_9AGAM|nr:hypothetical protein PISMIDRAFT_538595 [Pisolithus microcarpus 441]